jgi:hypothetical protein
MLYVPADFLPGREIDMRKLACILALLVAACGPNAKDYGDDGGVAGNGDGGPNGGPDANFGPVGSIVGTVWAPGQAPGSVPANQEIPVFGAVVYLSLQRPAGIPQETYCERCIDPPGGHTLTDHKGSFTLGNIQPNTYWLVIQKGQFRLEQQVVVTPSGQLDLPAEATTLPSVNDPTNGKWIPKIAMAIGNFDDLEDILGKMGLGQVDSTGRYVDTSSVGVLDIYDNGGSDFDNITTSGTLEYLVSDLNRLLQYHIIFIPCAGSSYTSALDNQQNLKNIRDFVAAGGKLYVTDWSGEWHDNVFPEQVELGGASNDTPASAYDASTDTWNTAQFGSANGSSYDSDNAEAVDTDLHTWLNGQVGPTADNLSATSTYNANSMHFEDNWNTIESLNAVQVGTDDEGLPVYDTPKAWVIGGSTSSPTPKKPLTVTYEPTGCGRVLFSTYHTTGSTHVGLVPQERVLLYLIMEIGVCKSGPIID